jgi:hypothetical protein
MRDVATECPSATSMWKGRNPIRDVRRSALKELVDERDRQFAHPQNDRNGGVDRPIADQAPRH